jgi:hypothetical protein
VTGPGLTACVPMAVVRRVVTVRAASYPSDLTDEQWELLEPVLNYLRIVLDAMLYIAHLSL